jgi:hypothetical protein
MAERVGRDGLVESGSLGCLLHHEVHRLGADRPGGIRYASTWK